MPKGNRTNHPSRAGIKLIAPKGHTAWINRMRVTPESAAQFTEIVNKLGVSRSEWIQAKIREEYTRLLNLTIK